MVPWYFRPRAEKQHQENFTYYSREERFLQAPNEKNLVSLPISVKNGMEIRLVSVLSF